MQNGGNNYLHSLGQFVQEGKKVLFETNLYVETPMIDLTFPNDEANEDGMNYLAGKSVDWANKMAAKGTLQAHEETGGVPNILLTMPGMTSYDFGNMCGDVSKCLRLFFIRLQIRHN